LGGRRARRRRSTANATPQPLLLLRPRPPSPPTPRKRRPEERLEVGVKHPCLRCWARPRPPTPRPRPGRPGRRRRLRRATGRAWRSGAGPRRRRTPFESDEHKSSEASQGHVLGIRPCCGVVAWLCVSAFFCVKQTEHARSFYFHSSAGRVTRKKNGQHHRPGQWRPHNQARAGGQCPAEPVSLSTARATRGAWGRQ
jgi:hypothetical protein